MSIPAGFSGCVIAPHGLIAWKHIFETARQHMVNAGLAISRRRPFIKTEQRTTFGLRQRFREDIVVAPELQHLCLKRWPVVTALYFLKWQNSHSKNENAMKLAPKCEKHKRRNSQCRHISRDQPGSLSSDPEALLPRLANSALPPVCEDLQRTPSTEPARSHPSSPGSVSLPE